MSVVLGVVKFCLEDYDCPRPNWIGSFLSGTLNTRNNSQAQKEGFLKRAVKDCVFILCSQDLMRVWKAHTHTYTHRLASSVFWIDLAVFIIPSSVTLVVTLSSSLSLIAALFMSSFRTMSLSITHYKTMAIIALMMSLRYMRWYRHMRWSCGPNRWVLKSFSVWVA